MEIIGNIVKDFFEWLQRNPYLGVLIILSSIIANFIAINDSFSQRRKSKEEKKLYEEIKTRLSQYEYLFGEIEVDKKFKKSISEKKEQLEEVSKDVEEQRKIKDEIEQEKQQVLKEKEQELRSLEDRLKQVVATAQNEALRQTIERRLLVIQQELSEIQELKEQYVLTDTQLDIPENIKANLTQTLREFLPENKARFPQSFIFQTVVLLTLVLLLPWPLDNVVLLISAFTLFSLILQAVILFNNDRLEMIVLKNYKWIVGITLYSLWKGVIDWLLNTFQIDTLFSMTYSMLASLSVKYSPHFVNIPSGGSDAVFTNSYVIGNQFLSYFYAILSMIFRYGGYILPLLVTISHYRKVIKPIKDRVNEVELNVEQNKNLEPTKVSVGD